MPGRDAKARESRARRCDLDVVLGVSLRAARPARLQQPELVQLPAELERDLGALAEVLERDRLDGRAKRARLAALPFLRPGGVELLADHAQRQELVALQAQDRRETLDVVSGEQAIPTACPLRRDQALVLEVANLGDGDVRELVAKRLADGTDLSAVEADIKSRAMERINELDLREFFSEFERQ